MTSESCTGSDPHVTRRLFTTLVLLITILCFIAGYLLGRMSRNEVRRGNEIISSNLTMAADNLFRKAKRITPKVVHHNDPGKMTQRILDIFHCDQNDCGSMADDIVADFIKSSVTYKVNVLIRSIQNASIYLESLR